MSSHNSSPSAPQEDPPSLERQLTEYKDTCQKASRAHYVCAEDSEHFNDVVGIPSIVIGVGVGSAILSGSTSGSPQIAGIMLGLLSISAGVLASLQTFFQFSERSKQHRVAGAEYGSVRRKIQLAQLRLSQASDSDVDASLQEISSDLDDLAARSPIIPDRIWDFVEGEHQRSASSASGKRARHWGRRVQKFLAFVVPVFLITLALFLEYPGAIRELIEELNGVRVRGSAEPDSVGRAPEVRPPRNSTQAWFNAVRNRPPLLRAFLQAMPKGADLHNHLSGAVYAEHLLLWADNDLLCIETSDDEQRQKRQYNLVACSAQRGAVPVSKFLNDPTKRDLVIDAWSMRNWVTGPQSGHDRFFSTFPQIGLVLDKRRSDAIAQVARQASRENILYMELMLSTSHRCMERLLDYVDGSPTFGPYGCGALDQLQWQARFSEAITQLRQREGRSWEKLAEVSELVMELDLAKWAQDALADLEEDSRRAGQRVACVEDGEACANVEWRFIQQVNRNKPLVEVLLRLVWAFSLVRQDGMVVGSNLVTPEDWRVSQDDYSEQMKLISLLRERKTFADLPISLHAGELTLGLVPPENLTNRIREAVELGGATRLGHAVSIGYEDEALSLLDLLAEEEVAVEINLSSNKAILDVSGSRHPFLTYMDFGVPVIISTDDAGVNRSDLTNEYQIAVEEHGLSYEEVKELSRQGLVHAFLQSDKKEELLREWERRFRDFEARDWPVARLR